MAFSELSPALFVAVAVCGGGSGTSGSSARDLGPTTSDGLTCGDLQIMIDVEIMVLSECSSSSECDQIIDDTGVCPTDDVILNIAYDASYLFWMLDEADSIDCELEFDTRGDCSEDAEPMCVMGTCAWR